MFAGTGGFARTQSVRFAAKQKVPQVSGYHDETTETGQDAFPGKPLGRSSRWMRVFMPMAKCGEAKQGKAHDRKEENQKILVLPASQENGQASGRQNAHQHPLMKSDVGEKTASQEGKSDQRNRHQQAMNPAYSSQGHGYAIQGELPSWNSCSYGSCLLFGHGDQGILLDKEKPAT